MKIQFYFQVTNCQIELRVLAHISGDEHLISAFNDGADIHTSTAMRVFGIDKPEKRCDSKWS